MSRLSGFSIKRNGEEVWSVCWKNYLCIDGYIWKNSKFNQQCGEQAQDGCNDFYIDYEAFEEMFNKLIGNYSSILTENEEALPKSIDDAISEWKLIISHLDQFVSWHTDKYKSGCTYEFFSCN